MPTVGTAGLFNPNLPESTLQNFQWAIATGTADAITAVYDETVEDLSDGLILGFRATAANATSAPTFSPDGQVAFPIVKNGGNALAIGDIPGAGAEVLVRYNALTSKWELLNPTKSSLTVASPTTKSANYTIANGDNGAVHSLGGAAFFTATLNAVAGYDSNFNITLINSEAPGGRAKVIAVNGFTNKRLWPGQSVIVRRVGAVWVPIYSNLRGRVSGTSVNVDYTNGLDTNDGMATGAGNALKTIQAALELFRTELDMGGGGAIQLANGTHEVGAGLNLTYSPVMNAGQVIITGDTGTPGNVTIRCAAAGACALAREPGSVTTFSGVRFATLGASGETAISASQGAIVDLAFVEFGSFPGGFHVSASTMAFVNFIANETILGGCASHIVASFGAYVNFGGITVSIPSASGFTTFAQATSHGMIAPGAITFTGAGAGGGSSGQRYDCSYGGLIFLGGSTYPGTVAGSAATGNGNNVV